LRFSRYGNESGGRVAAGRDGVVVAGARDAGEMSTDTHHTLAPARRIAR
jgi:hypothetical protein